MNGNNVLLDTNIVLYFLNGEKTLIPLLEGKNIYLSLFLNLNYWEAKILPQKIFSKLKYSSKNVL